MLSNIYYKQLRILVWGCADLSVSHQIKYTGVVLMEGDLYINSSEKIAYLDTEYFHTKLVSK